MIFPVMIVLEFRFCIGIFKNFRNLYLQSFKIQTQTIMKIKPSSANPKKSLLIDKAQSSKKPTVVKCFICNQMFYSQQTFDSHMDLHQKKVDKNLPDQIQRKTMESFGLKRNSSGTKKTSTLQALNQNQIKDKNSLNKTLKFPLKPIQLTQNPFITQMAQTKSSVLKKPLKNLIESNKRIEQIKRGSESPSKNQIPAEKQIQEIDQALRQSSLLMSQITFITEKYENQSQNINTEEALSQDESVDEELVIQKTISEHEFIKQVKKSNLSLSSIEEKILNVKFSQHKSLQNCQIQILYLRQLLRLFKDKLALEKTSKIKSKILAEVIKIIMSDESQGSKYQFKPNNNTQQAQEQENHSARNCSECLAMIVYGEICTIQGDLFFHKDCFVDRNQSKF